MFPVILIFVEGRSDVAFMKWISEITAASDRATFIIQAVDGGGYKNMLYEAKLHRNKNRKRYPSYLIPDADLALNGTENLEEFRIMAEVAGFILYLQVPNLEGILIKMMPNNENKKLEKDTKEQLKRLWTQYSKGRLSAADLHDKFTIEDLDRVAKVDKNLAEIISIFR